MVFLKNTCWSREAKCNISSFHCSSQRFLERAVTLQLYTLPLPGPCPSPHNKKLTFEMKHGLGFLLPPGSVTVPLWALGCWGWAGPGFLALWFQGPNFRASQSLHGVEWGSQIPRKQSPPPSWLYRVAPQSANPARCEEMGCSEKGQGIGT